MNEHLFHLTDIQIYTDVWPPEIYVHQYLSFRRWFKF